MKSISAKELNSQANSYRTLREPSSYESGSKQLVSLLSAKKFSMPARISLHFVTFAWRLLVLSALTINPEVAVIRNQTNFLVHQLLCLAREQRSH